MTVQVPCENADKVGLRRVIGEKEVGVVLKALTGGSTEMPKNWNRRFKHNRDKMKTGDILELAEVVRNLALRDHEKGLSTGEKQMFVKAKKILASELMYAKDMDEDECAEWLEEVLAADGPTARRRRRPKKKAVARDGLAAGSCPSGPILVAAGRGERLGLDQPKAFAKLGEDPLLAEPLRRLEESDWIDGDRPRRAARAGRSRRSSRRGARLRQGARVRDRRRDARRLGARRARRGARRRARRARARRRAPARLRRGDRARARAALGGLGRRRAGAAGRATR